MTPQGKPAGLRIDGADGEIEIKPGRFYMNTKARCERMMQSRYLSCGARRLYACLESMTMGWKQELAVLQEAGAVRAATTTDLEKLLGEDRANVRKLLDELEAAGLGERRSIDDGPLRKGRVGIYSWAEPRAVPEAKKEVARTPPSWVPVEWEPLVKHLNRLRLNKLEELPEDLPESARNLLFSECDEAARLLVDAESRVRAVGERLRALCAYKEERTKDTEGKKGGGDPPPSAPSSSTPSEPPPPPPSPPPTPQPSAKSEVPPESKALALPNLDEAEKLVLYQSLSNTMQAAGRPVTVELNARCWPLFRDEPIGVCRRILKDAEPRCLHVWTKEKNKQWVPTLLSYLQKRPWESEPIGHPITAGQLKEIEYAREDAELRTHLRAMDSARGDHV